MSEITSLAYRPESVLAHGQTLRSELKAADERVDDIALLLAKTKMGPTIFERIVTIEDHLRRAIDERAVTEFVCEVDLESELPIYMKQGAALALRDGVEVNL
jgi:hypothetical protein